jgi:uncharacterized protein YdcH (DUF465 family)
MIDHLENRLIHLDNEHQAIDKRIDGLESTGVFEDATLEVLKKQRLYLKDEIVKIKAKILHELSERGNN